MSLKPEGIQPIPEETARIAHAAYPKGTVFMHMRDELGTIYQDETFAHLFSHTGQPAEAPWRLALVTIMQFAEGCPVPAKIDSETRERYGTAELIRRGIK